ncbi:thiamine pyrophosphate-dependent dehydrogenase E1 component subunit alpha [Variovorax boronicumulans]|uniref:thiamine pyrophosphate-dependent dehydrogenase E1 component subunit alpha n=1 Tax=Variovorax boronicumulans TaxID=436515 RepID=UPI001C57D238
MTLESARPDVPRLTHMYRAMLRIRAVENTLARIFADGEVPGFIHLSIGQEAVAVGVASAMAEGDTLATTHRGHGHVLARGLDLDGFFKEIMGRAGGICRGRGGSMHVADMTLGIIGANGIVGAGIPIALGSALALKTRATGGIAAALFGDGAMAEGVLHESLNLAALQRLPLLFVCENNGWSEFSRTERQFAAPLAKLATAFGIVHEAVDGNDVLAVAAAAEAAVAALRAGQGPRVLECRTHRTRGHFEGDAQKYRDAAELQAGIDGDAVLRTATALRNAAVEEEALTALHKEVETEVAAALQRARSDAWPRFEEAFADVYTLQEA